MNQAMVRSMTHRTRPRRSLDSILAGDAGDDPALAQPGAGLGGVVGLVGMQLGRLASARASAGPDRRNRPDQGLKGLVVIGVRGADGHRQGQAIAVG